MNNYTKLAKQNYNKHWFDVKDGHIKNCKIIWSREDVIGAAKDKGITLTEDEIDEILYVLVQKHDAELGVSWITIDFWIDEIVSEREE